MIESVPVIESVTDIADVNTLTTAAERYAELRRFSPRFLAAFRFQSSTPDEPLRAAIDLPETEHAVPALSEAS